MPMSKSTLKLMLIAVATLAAHSFAALPEMRITTQGTPTSQNGGSCPGAWTSPMQNTHIFKYVRVTKFQIIDQSNPVNNITRENLADSLRLRGNSTVDADKKPYRIKLGEKRSLFGKEAARSWVLLANYYDGTFALNAIAFEMGKRMGLEFTNSSQLVDLWINNEYKGIYQLTEQVQSHKGRVDLKENKRGWLVEMDYHAPASDECKEAFIADPAGGAAQGCVPSQQNNWCQNQNQCVPSQQNNWCQNQTQTQTSGNYNITAYIKSPELDDTAFTRNPNDSSQLRFVKTDINALVSKMKEGGFPNNGYRDLIDLESFAKYVLIQMVLDNFDFNNKTEKGGLMGSNYMYRIDSSKTSKIKAGPLWDFDLAAGVRNDNATIGGIGGGCYPGQPNCNTAAGFPAHYQTYQDPVTPTSPDYSHVFYKRLWEDNVFKARYKKLWLRHKSDFQAMSSLIDQIKSQVEGSVQGKGTNIWANNSLYMSGALTTQQFNTEVSNLKTWLNNRINWVDGQINTNAIDVNWDVPDPPVQDTPKTPTSAAPAPAGFGRAGNGLAVVKNGLRINATGPASVKVFTLTGGAVRKREFTAGSHTVHFGDLPCGVYLVRVNLDGVKKTVRVAVR